MPLQNNLQATLHPMFEDVERDMALLDLPVYTAFYEQTRPDDILSLRKFYPYFAEAWAAVERDHFAYQALLEQGVDDLREVVILRLMREFRLYLADILPPGGARSIQERAQALLR